MNTKGKEINQVFVPDIMKKYEIISYFKDLIDIGPLLPIDWEEKMSLFKKKLQEFGWDENEIGEMVAIACSKSRHLLGLPLITKSKGDWLEWLGYRARIK